jgi:hypothetical protein
MGGAGGAEQWAGAAVLGEEFEQKVTKETKVCLRESEGILCGRRGAFWL